MTDATASRTNGAAAPLRSRLFIAILALGILLGVLGPFGSYLGMGLPVRLLHYTASMITISALAVIANGLVARFVFRGPVPLWGALAIAVVLGPPAALIVSGFLQLWAPQVLPHVTFADLCVQAALINVVASLLVHAVRNWMTAPAPVAVVLPALREPEPSPAIADDPLRAKLPLPLRSATIVALSAEDHYLRVHTARGEALVLMSLAAGMAALGSEAGIQVHRSHWIAHAALADGSARLGRAGIVLARGPTLPVSRAGRRRLADGKLV
ncbi:MAG: LytTR family transcriptional regulator DNA-binding domain-containing protein [Phreatobacter sp.]|uniref:LytTR family DNA-binding domain-containing protein n=1 Tax=Phreatobacter sp. TaxID=1966341 RepID=UPI001A38B617|nr:LytTR family DNA-binding domain-containing protein [Phreatobacter sp.]MBL8569201.1 LytTR family transcriptional regulator DNA-binding domain-containing protein [Phreatobacter sp.]